MPRGEQIGKPAGQGSARPVFSLRLSQEGIWGIDLIPDCPEKPYHGSFPFSPLAFLSQRVTTPSSPSLPRSAVRGSAPPRVQASRGGPPSTAPATAPSISTACTPTA